MGFGSFAWPDWLKGPLLIVLAALALPATFLFSSTHAWDRQLGELSYPLYLCHTLVIFWAARAPPEGWVRGEHFSAPAVACVLVASLTLAALLHHWVQEPIEAYRRRPRMNDLTASARPPLDAESMLAACRQWLMAGTANGRRPEPARPGGGRVRLPTRARRSQRIACR